MLTGLQGPAYRFFRVDDDGAALARHGSLNERSRADRVSERRGDAVRSTAPRRPCGRDARLGQQPAGASCERCVSIVATSFRIIGRGLYGAGVCRMLLKGARRYGFVYNLGMRRDHIKYSFTTDTLAVCTSQPAVPDKDDGKSGRRCTQLVAQFIYAAPMTYPSDVIQLTEVIHGQQRLPKGQPRRGGPRERYTLGSIPFRLQENL